MELSLLPPILLALAEQRSLDAVLSTIVETVAGQPDGIKAPDTIRFAVRSEARFQVGAGNRTPPPLPDAGEPGAGRKSLGELRSGQWRAMRDGIAGICGNGGSLESVTCRF